MIVVVVQVVVGGQQWSHHSRQLEVVGAEAVLLLRRGLDARTRGRKILPDRRRIVVRLTWTASVHDHLHQGVVTVSVIPMVFE